MIADPRSRNTVAAPDVAGLHRLAEASLAAQAAGEAERIDHAIAHSLDAMLASGDGDRLAEAVDHAPSVAVERHLLRILGARAAAPPEGEAGVRLFALPVVVVAGAAGEAGPRATIPGVIPNADALEAILAEHDALGGNRAFALSPTLCTADAIELRRLPAILRHARQPDARSPIDLAPAPLEAHENEAAHLRFIVGSALASRVASLFAERDAGRWGRPFAAALMSALATPGVTLVALPRPPQPLPLALSAGRAAQREVGAQLFASRAIRELRASVGEPVAIVSAHAASDAPGGGELRLSLSSPLSPRDAQGFRCPLYRGERVEDVVAMLEGLLADFRVGDVRLVDGVHADRDPVTGGRLMFKPDTLPSSRSSMQ